MTVEFFDSEKLVTYSAILPNPRDDFYLDDELVHSAQEQLFAKNMAEKSDLRGVEVINSIFSALIVNRKSKTFRLAVKIAVVADREKKGCLKYAGFRMTSGNHQKLKDMMELIREVAPLPEKQTPFISRVIFGDGKQPLNMEMSVAIDVVLNIFQMEIAEG